MAKFILFERHCHICGQIIMTRSAVGNNCGEEACVKARRDMYNRQNSQRQYEKRKKRKRQRRDKFGCNAQGWNDCTEWQEKRQARPWTEPCLYALLTEWTEGATIEQMAKWFGRTQEDIEKHLPVVIRLGFPGIAKLRGYVPDLWLNLVHELDR